MLINKQTNKQTDHSSVVNSKIYKALDLNGSFDNELTFRSKFFSLCLDRGFNLCHIN